MPPGPLLIFVLISVGTTIAIAFLTAVMGWTVASPAWSGLGPIAMWAPALAAFAARRAERPRFITALSPRRWGVTGARVIAVPLALPLVVYGAAYVIAGSAGLVHWSPGNGKWTTGSQIAINVIVNLTLLAAIGTFTAMGEEIGWRGYLQPRLDAAGIRASVLTVWIVQVAYHTPLMIGADYADVGGFGLSFSLFALGDLPISFIMAKESYLARSLWPAVFFHSFHNTISQWLFPKLFTVSDNQLWLRGEMGLLPTIGYIVIGTAMYAWMRLRGQTWETRSREALAPRSL